MLVGHEYHCATVGLEVYMCKHRACVRVALPYLHAATCGKPMSLHMHAPFRAIHEVSMFV